MEGQRSRRKLAVLVVGIVMIMVLGGGRVQGQTPGCIFKCQLFCAGTKASSACYGLCLKNCMKPLPQALFYCSLGCATSKCNHFTSEKVEGCVDSCSNKCSQAYALH
ncbi:Thionin-like protein [Parasponia andersonii]|uniref:Thionin-like protein n=1 Tax=Parasponia andersonii TaxID=3476 RepID=A0A2P5AHL7_PARAD|nr:Thionin-like protein [Parasponia andersonii]